MCSPHPGTQILPIMPCPPQAPCLLEGATDFPKLHYSLLPFLLKLIIDIVCTAQITTYYGQHSVGCCFTSLISSIEAVLLQTRIIPKIISVVSAAPSTALSPKQVFNKYLKTACRMINSKVSLGGWRFNICHSCSFVPCWDGMNIFLSNE